MTTNGGMSHQCLCDADYSGTQCETQNNCVPSCVSTQGRCTCPNTYDSECPATGVCSCYANYVGSQCATDACAATGGVAIGPSVCNCTAVSGVQYPNINTNPLYLDMSFKGCRRMCAVTASGPLAGNECGGLSEGNYSRCTSSVIAANSPVMGSPGCDCARRAPNPLVVQYASGMIKVGSNRKSWSNRRGVRYYCSTISDMGPRRRWTDMRAVLQVLLRDGERLCPYAMRSPSVSVHRHAVQRPDMPRWGVLGWLQVCVYSTMAIRRV